MSLEQRSILAQVVGSVGVFVSLIFVGLQIKQNTNALQRTEHGLIPGFVVDVDAVLARDRGAS